MDLRPYQHEAGDRTVAGFLDEHLNRLLVKMPTGTGKTVLFAALLKWARLRDWLEDLKRSGQQRGASMLVIAHREELLLQAQAKIQAANPGLMVAIEQADAVASRYSDVIVASIQTLSARKFTRLKRLLQHHTFRVVIVDEAHHAAAASYRTTLAYLGFLPMADASESEETEAATWDDVERMKGALTGWDQQAAKDRLLIGVTATPNRSDAIGLGCVFQSIAYNYGLKQAIDDGWLAPIRPWVIETAESLDAVRTSHGDFNQKDLAETVNTPRRNLLAVESWKLHADGLSTLAFTVDVQHAHDVAATFQARGVAAVALSGETPREERRQILRDYTDGKIQVIANCMVLTEGTDLPRTSCILHMKPTKSATLYEQMTGRGLRIHPGKTECVVIDVVDVARRHTLQAAPVLYGLPPGLKTNGEDLQQIQDALEDLRQRYPQMNIDELLEHNHFSIQELRDRASTFDVWKVPDLGEFAAVATMNWIRSGADTFRVSYPWGDGTETLSVQPDVLGHYDVTLTLRPHSLGTSPHQRTPVAPGHRAPGAPPPPTRQRTLASQVVTPIEALKFAEHFVAQERASVRKLKDRGAPWRARPASPKQVDYLRRLRIPFDPKAPLTMGQASDLIDMHHARKGR